MIHLESDKTVGEEHSKATVHKTAGARYLGDFVFGALDGSITTFAIVAGAAGAALSPSVVLILGFANLLGDGASMALGNYLGTKSEEEFLQRQRRTEEWETEHLPEQEREEVRQIYHGKGFRGKELDRAVDIVTSNKKVWVDTMMREELNVPLEEKSARLSGLATFAAFVSVGLVPLLVYVVALFAPIVEPTAFPVAVALTFVAIFGVGSARSIVTGKSWWRAGLEMTVVGAIAASIAFSVGRLLAGIISL